MKKIIFLSIIFCSCAQVKTPTSNEIETYCQDLNILYQRIGAISSNIANVNTTRTIEGGYYKRKIPKNCKKGFCDIVNDESPPILKYNPKHPDANKQGYVAYPNINLKQEEADQAHWSSVYTVVTANSPVSHSSFFFKDPQAKNCFKKYPSLKANLDYSEYLGRDTNN